MFAVFGVNNQVVKKAALKKMESFLINDKGVKRRPEKHEYEKQLLIYEDELFESMGAKQLSAEFSTLSIAEEFRKMQEKEPNRLLHIKVKVKTGKRTKSGKESTAWKRLSV